MGRPVPILPGVPGASRKLGFPHLIRDIRAALDAKVWFSEHGPDWANPLPMGAECAVLFRARGPLYLLGAYAFSLQMLYFDFRTHPSFHDFGCGAMATPSAPRSCARRRGVAGGISCKGIARTLWPVGLVR